MKKAKILLMPTLLAGVLTGCGDAKQAFTDALKIKKATDYLYEATLDYDFDYNFPKEFYKKYVPNLGGCSAISIGNVRGRNYDWEYSAGTEFVVRATARNGRHASIGISSLTGTTNDEVQDGKFHAEYEALPFLTLDGINDAGIYVNVNVVPFQGLGKWGMKNDDDKDDLCELCGPRLVLDNCAYLEDVIKEYDKYDWFSLGNQEETHLMVTGPRSQSDKTVSTVVFEFVPFTENGRTFRKFCVISNNDADKVIVGNDMTRFYKTKAKNIIMTNFNLWKFDGELSREEQLGDGEGSILNNQPMGFERYETLYAAGAKKDKVTMQEMQDIMKQVHYCNAYNLFQPNFWYTEYNLTKAELKVITESERNPKGDINKVYSGNAEALALIKTQQAAWSNRDRAKGAAQGLWETIHTSIFNYDTRSFRVIPREGNIFYDYTL